MKITSFGYSVAVLTSIRLTQLFKGIFYNFNLIQIDWFYDTSALNKNNLKLKKT